MTIKLVLTGEPAGIELDLVLAAAMKTWDAGWSPWVIEPCLLRGPSSWGCRSSSSRIPPVTHPAPIDRERCPSSTSRSVTPATGAVGPTNASYVMAQLDMAVSLCQAGDVVMVTAPGIKP